MKITKEEKQLYKLLDVVNKIFGKTSDRTIICGDNSNLYFYTQGYCGVFISIDNDDTLVDAYDFENHFYELKQLPNKSFVLDIQSSDVLKVEEEQKLYHNVTRFIDSQIRDKKWVFETYKDYDHKIAKIASITGKWIRDEDISYLKMFNEFEVFHCDNSLVFKSEDEYCDVFFVMNGSVVIPDYDDNTQMKIDAYMEDRDLAKKNVNAINENPPVVEEPLEEFEDEEYIEESFDDEDDDPMA